MSIWEKVALKVQEETGVHIDWIDRFFECPECGEPIYEEDYNHIDDYIPDSYSNYICPVCEQEIAERERD